MKPESIPEGEATGQWRPVIWQGNGADVGDLQGLWDPSAGATMARWKMNPAERAALLGGATVEVVIQHGSQPLQPLVLGVHGLWDVVGQEGGTDRVQDFQDAVRGCPECRRTPRGGVVMEHCAACRQRVSTMALLLFDT